MAERDEMLAVIINALDAAGIALVESKDAEDFAKQLEDRGYAVVRVTLSDNSDE